MEFIENEKYITGTSCIQYKNSVRKVHQPICTNTHIYKVIGNSMGRSHEGRCSYMISILSYWKINCLNDRNHDSFSHKEEI